MALAFAGLSALGQAADANIGIALKSSFRIVAA
jgi:hypothetical protein